MLSAINTPAKSVQITTEVEKITPIQLPPVKIEQEPDTSATALVEVATLSVIGRQLSESAERASQRERTMSRDELAAYATRQTNKFLFEGYKAGKVRHDLETPQTEDPELLERARRATEYVNRPANSDMGARNPFAGLSRDQLIIIAYDDRGGYTINERRAAWCSSARMEAEWAKGAVARGQLESSLTGKVAVFLSEVLNYYKGLPKIEKVQDRYPQHYEAEMEEKISAELALPASSERKPLPRDLNLYDILADMTVPKDRQLKLGDPASLATLEVD